MQAPEILDASEELRASGLAGRDPEAYRRRAFELSVAGYFRDPRDAANLTPFRVTARTQEAVWASLGEYDLRERLAALPLPASSFRAPLSLVLHGTHDPIAIAGSRELAQILGAEFVELPVGHCPHVEATAAFVRALDNFLPAA
jgi:proline iminopeptidase